jgi:hypothetical protein
MVGSTSVIGVTASVMESVGQTSKMGIARKESGLTIRCRVRGG